MSRCSIDRVYGPFSKANIDLDLPGAHHPYVVEDRVARWWVIKPLPARGILGEIVGALLGGR